MSDYDNTNRGALFKKTERKSDKHPEYDGPLNVGGVEYQISAWVREGKNGKFFSLSVKPKEERKEASGGAAPFEDPMPF